MPTGTNRNVFLLRNRRIETVALGEWLRKAHSLINTLPEEPSSSINALIGFALDKPVHFGISHPEYVLTTAEESMLDALLNRLLMAEPLPYITGKQEFFGLEFKMTSDVLIPRPETELLVENALDWLQKRNNNSLVADVGTGSGCIAVSLGKKLPSAKIVGTDVFYKALKIAQANVNSHGLDGRIALVQTDLLSGIQPQFDCICANLPYISSGTLSGLTVEDFEPLSALDGGQDGLRYIEPLLFQSRSRIKPNGLILLEIEATQSQAVFNLAASVFPVASIKILADLAGNPRLACIEMKNG